MKWVQMINSTTDYIEKNIMQNIDLRELARQCGVSYYHFTRMFSMITDYTLKEYIRNRRITLASYDLTNTRDKVIDIALRYGYSSNESFTRAFKKVHGVNPSDVRRGIVNVYTHFPVVNYDITEQNLIALRYDIVTDLSYNLSGKSIHIVEENYDETQKCQQGFIDEFLLRYPSTSRYYRIHLNLREDNLEYDYFVGYEKEKLAKLDTLRLEIPKAVRFYSSHLNPVLIPRLKKIIYAEWEKCKFLSTYQCEVEYSVENDDGTVDFHYIVSIK